MAVREKSFDYNAVIKDLHENGPQRFYLLSGEEDYLRESFVAELGKTVLEGGFAEFNHKRVSEAQPDLSELSRAVDTVPFFGAGTFIELRDFDINKCRGDYADKLLEIVSDLPEYCTVAIVTPTGYEPDGRLSLIKSLKKCGTAIDFKAQGDALLYRWISRRFAALGKKIGQEEARLLVFMSGSLMNGLIPEIEKLASYAEGEYISEADIYAVATRLPETKVYFMTDHIAERRYDKAAEVMAELLDMKEHPIMLNAVIGSQIRKLYSARIALDSGKTAQYIAKLWGIKDYAASRLMSSARGFTAKRLADAVCLCAETDLKLKSSALEPEDLIKDLLLKLALEGECA